MGEIKRYDRIEPDSHDLLEQALRAVDVVRLDGEPCLVVLPQRVALDVSPVFECWLPWGSADLTYRARVEVGGARVQWRHRNRAAGESAWTWKHGGWCDERLLHYLWEGLAEQVAFDDRLVWTCIEWQQAHGSSVVVEARDRLGFAQASLAIRPMREPTRWAPSLKVSTDNMTRPAEAVGSLEEGMRLFAPIIAAQHRFGVLDPRSSDRSANANRRQRALAIWEGSHVLYHAPTSGAPLVEVWADDFEALLLEWWRDNVRDRAL